MTVLALGLVACGDDNNDSSSSQGTNAQTTTTGTTKTTTTTDDSSKSKTTDDSTKHKSSSSKHKSSSSHKKSSSTPKTTNSGRGTTTAPSDPNRNKNANKHKQLYTPQEAEDLSSQFVAKRVCQTLLPKQTERDLKAGRTTIEKVAAQYAKGWPAKKQTAARKGCLQGLKARQK